MESTKQAQTTTKRPTMSRAAIDFSLGEILFDRDLPSSLELIPAFVSRIMSYCSDYGLMLDLAERMHTTSCVEEALRNAMIHGNKSQFAKKVRLQIFRTANEWGFVIRDEGDGFDNSQPDREPGAPEPPAGFGSAIMNHYMDRVAYFEGGRVLVLSRKRQLKPAAKTGKRDYSELEANGILEVEAQGDIVVVRFRHSRIRDHKNTNEALDKLNEHCLALANCKLILNLGKAEYLSSVAIGRCVSLLKRLRSNGGDMRLCCLRPELKSVIRVVQIDRMMGVHETEEEAIQAARISTPQSTGN